MKIITIRRQLMLGCVCAGLFFSRDISAQEHAPAKQKEARRLWKRPRPFWMTPKLSFSI